MGDTLCACLSGVLAVGSLYRTEGVTKLIRQPAQPNARRRMVPVPDSLSALSDRASSTCCSFRKSRARRAPRRPEHFSWI